MKMAVKIATLVMAGLALTACQHLSTPPLSMPPKTSVADDETNDEAAMLKAARLKVAMLNDASHLCQKELQGDVSFKHINHEIKLYCTFRDKTGESVEVDAMTMVRELAKGMAVGDTMKADEIN